MLKSLSLLMFFLFLASPAWAHHDRTRPPRDPRVGRYVLTPDGRVGTVGIMNDPKVVVSFHDLEKATAHSESHLLSQVQIEVPYLRIASGEMVERGTFVTLKNSYDKAYEVRAAFPNGKVAVSELVQRLNSKFTLRKEHLVDGSEISGITAQKTFYEDFIARTEIGVQKDLRELHDNLKRTARCLKVGDCNFSVQSRLDVQTGLTSFDEQLDTFPVRSADELFRLLRHHAVQYKLYSGLANGDIISRLDLNFPNAMYKSIAPLPGMDPIVFNKGKPENEFAKVQSLKDIESITMYMNHLAKESGATFEDLGDAFEKKRICIKSECSEVSFFKEFTQPLYQDMVQSMVRAQPFLSFLNWKLDKADIQQALERAQHEAAYASQFIKDLKPEERGFILSFNKWVDIELNKLSPAQRTLFHTLIEQEEAKKTFWSEVVKEIQRPQFWGVLACYGVAALTPAKFTVLLCHAAGIGVTIHSLYVHSAEARSLYGLQKLKMIDPALYQTALLGIMLEASLGAMYLGAALPDFTAPFKAAATAAAKPALEVGANNLKNLIHNRFAEALREQFSDFAIKYTMLTVFSRTQLGTIAYEAFVATTNTYEGKLLTASSVYSQIMLGGDLEGVVTLTDAEMDLLKRRMTDDEKRIDNYVELMN